MYVKSLNQTGFEINSEYDFSASSILMPKTLHDLAKQIDPSNKAFLVISNKHLKLNNLKFTAPTNSLPNNDYYYVTEDNLFAKMLDKNTLIQDTYSKCNPMNCSGPEEVGCKIDDGGGLDCRGDITDLCIMKRTNEEIIKQKVSVTPLDLQVARNFRDNFLNNSLQGKQFINYYYKINYILQGIDFTQKVNLLAQYNLELKLYSLVDKIQHGGLNDILFDENDKQYFTIQLNKASTLSSNQEFQGIITSLKNAVSNYANKTKASILAEF